MGESGGIEVRRRGSVRRRRSEAALEQCIRLLYQRNRHYGGAGAWKGRIRGTAQFPKDLQSSWHNNQRLMAVVNYPSPQRSIASYLLRRSGEIVRLIFRAHWIRSQQALAAKRRERCLDGLCIQIPRLNTQRQHPIEVLPSVFAMLFLQT